MSFKDVSVVLAHGAWGRWVELVLGDRPAEGRRRQSVRGPTTANSLADASSERDQLADLLDAAAYRHLVGD